MEFIEQHFLIILIVILFILFTIIGYLVERMRKKDNLKKQPEENSTPAILSMPQGEKIETLDN